MRILKSEIIIRSSSSQKPAIWTAPRARLYFTNQNPSCKDTYSTKFKKSLDSQSNTLSHVDRYNTVQTTNTSCQRRLHYNFQKQNKTGNMAGIINATLEALHLREPIVPPTNGEKNELKDKYEAAGQDHVFAFYDKLSAAEQRSLYDQLADFNPERVTKLAKKALSPENETPTVEGEDSTKGIEPLPESSRATTLDCTQEELQEWMDIGLDLIGQNKVAVVLMAGGQGTRLGSSAPKGCYDIGLPSKKSLFQLQAERIYRIQVLAAAKKTTSEFDIVVPWYIMTSGPTRKPTEDFFRKNNYFGLLRENVIFFEQGVLPCISNEGKIILETKSKVAVAPDGNGGIYTAMQKSGVLADLQKRNIEHVHAYCVDNCLVKVADPVFIGLSSKRGVEIATKVVRKRDASEAVGLIIKKNGKPDVVEYSEIDEDLRKAMDPNNHKLLKFRSANIVNHYYSIDFLKGIPEWAESLPHHIAKKKIPFCDTESGELVKPDKPNGIKLEQFVFDVFPQISMDKFLCLEVAREDEFSPLKNGLDAKEDNARTSKEHIMSQGNRWLKNVNCTILSQEMDNDGIEVSPLMSYGGEGLEFLRGQTITGPAVIATKSEES